MCTKEEMYEKIQKVNKIRLNNGYYPYTDVDFENMWNRAREKILQIIKSESKDVFGSNNSE